MYKFTVITPVYNGEKTIHRVYESLKLQTFKDFEWIVVNDASTDGTDELIKNFIKDGFFPIVYLQNEQNKMKGFSVDKAIKSAQGELTLIADSDDEFSHNTLEKVMSVWKSFSGKRNISTITCSCQDQYGNFIGTPFPQSPWISNEMSMRFKHKIKGEKWNITKTDVLKQYPFSVPSYEFVPLSYVWMQIASKYDSVFINDTLRTYYVNEESHCSITSTYKRNPSKWADGTAYCQCFLINEYSSLILKDNFPSYLIFFIRYIYYSHLAKIPLSKGLKNLKGLQNKITFLLMLLPGYLYIFLKKSPLWEKIKKLCAA